MLCLLFDTPLLLIIGIVRYPLAEGQVIFDKTVMRFVTMGVVNDHVEGAVQESLEIVYVIYYA